jgi:tRNA pseudouridine13 synthase
MDPTLALPYAYGTPLVSGSIKDAPEDFIVEEVLSFTPNGEGEHVFLRIEKSQENTAYVARQLKKLAGVGPQAVGYAGLKDRHGRTSQWFSVQIQPDREPDWSKIESSTIRILETTRNLRKLRKGAIRCNRFQLILRNLTGDLSSLENRLQQVRDHGVPNYFGPQRFGRDGQNVEQARAYFLAPTTRLDPQLRGLYLSAARADIFNRVLAERVRLNTWNQAIPGDVFMFPDSMSFFKAKPEDEDLEARLLQHQIHASGPLVGEAPSPADAEAASIEASVLNTVQDLCLGLANLRMETARRPLRLCPVAMHWTQPASDVLALSFELPSGAYATTVLRELITTQAISFEA